MSDEVRIGVLGAARIAPMALIKPAREVPGAVVAAVAARDRRRAEAFASKHGVPRVFGDYDALLADPDLDAVYIPLPNGLHREWMLKALAAGKHVLCEKPFTSNAREAEEVAAAAATGDRVVMEAFHYRYHPLAERMREVVTSGELGEVQRIETWMCIPLPLPGDIRYRLDLAGGATMDTGSYSIHMLRFLAGAEPEVVATETRLSSPDVDRWMSAEVSLPGGVTGRATCSLMSSTLLKIAVRVVGTEGSLEVFNPVAPQLAHRFRVRTSAGVRSERFSKRATYSYQLEAFVAAVTEGGPVATPPEDSVANMRVIDAVYAKAGLPLRGT